MPTEESLREAMNMAFALYVEAQKGFNRLCRELSLEPLENPSDGTLLLTKAYLETEERLKRYREAASRYREFTTKGQISG